MKFLLIIVLLVVTGCQGLVWRTTTDEQARKESTYNVPDDPKQARGAWGQ